MRLSSVLLIVLCVAAPSSARSAGRVALDGFAIDRTEVTIGEFRRFARAVGLVTAAEREGGGFEYAAGWTRRPGWSYERPQGQTGADDEPAAHVAWAEAEAYCIHAGGRLPTLAEWRRAAYTEQRAQPPDGLVAGRVYPYPVGERPDGMSVGRRAALAVAATRPGVNGLYDMGGNVWEWLADRRGEDALTAGGSWWYGPEQTRAEGAQWKPAGFYAVYVGFRCVYDGGR